MNAASRAAWLPALALSLNAFIWGVSWWPFRQLQAAGLHPLWATALVYLLSVLIISAHRPGAWDELRRTPALWVLVLASGTTNASFNWAMTIGDVVRVVLLFYLMPLWAVLLARALLGEAFTALAWLRVVLAVTGAGIVLWPAGGGGWPLPRALPDALAVIGGMAFALNNVMLRREAARSVGARGLALFVGGAVVAAALAAVLGQPLPQQGAADWLPGVLALALVFLAGNLGLQYGAARLPANVTAVIMITEVLFASGSAVLLGASTLGWPLVAGGSLIVAASLLAARAGEERPGGRPVDRP